MKYPKSQTLQTSGWRGVTAVPPTACIYNLCFMTDLDHTGIDLPLLTVGMFSLLSFLQSVLRERMEDNSLGLQISFPEPKFRIFDSSYNSFCTETLDFQLLIYQKAPAAPWKEAAPALTYGNRRTNSHSGSQSQWTDYEDWITLGIISSELLSQKKQKCLLSVELTVWLFEENFSFSW